jgi:hypothetical protein
LKLTLLDFIPQRLQDFPVYSSLLHQNHVLLLHLPFLNSTDKMQRNKILSQDIIDDEGSDSPMNDEGDYGSQYKSEEEQQNEKSFEEEIKSAGEEVENNDEPMEDINNEENIDNDDNNTNEQKADTPVNENKSSSNSNTSTTKKLLPPCRYGAGCTRGNPVHISQFSHPCKYGAQCTRKNPQHFIECLHPCPYGTACKRKNPDHFKQCTHPAPGEAEPKATGVVCILLDCAMRDNIIFRKNTRYDEHFLESCHMARQKKKDKFFRVESIKLILLIFKYTNTIQICLLRKEHALKLSPKKKRSPTTASNKKPSHLLAQNEPE